MARIDKRTLIRNPKAVTDYIDVLKALKRDFQVIQSNYSTTVTVHNSTTKFITSLMNKSVFITNAIIKRDLMNTHLLGGDLKTKVDFFDINENYPEVKPGESFTNIDLSAAYPTVLYNHEIITEDSYNRLMELSKPDRLASIGMFAAKKVVFDYARGELTSPPEITTNPLENVFWFASLTTDEVMYLLKQICGDLFIFYWFDGIYFKSNQYVTREICDTLDFLGYPYKVETLTNLVIKDKDLTFELSYTNSKGKSKTFNVPNQAKIRRANHLINLHLKNNYIK